MLRGFEKNIVRKIYRERKVEKLRNMKNITGKRHSPIHKDTGATLISVHKENATTHGSQANKRMET